MLLGSRLNANHNIRHVRKKTLEAFGASIAGDVVAVPGQVECVRRHGAAAVQFGIVMITARALVGIYAVEVVLARFVATVKILV